MTKLAPSFQNRDYSAKLTDPSLRWSVDSFRWQAVGGPAEAQLSATSTQLGLWTLLDYLRCPVSITDERGRSAWWGYVSSAEITQGNITFGASLDTMGNKVSVMYSYLAPASKYDGEGKQTSAVTDATSAGEYGTIERYVQISSASDAQAGTAMYTWLNRLKYPVPSISFGSGGEDKATLTCSGWYGSLDFLHYAQSGTANVDTAVQGSAVASSCGQFLSAVDIDLSGGTTGIYGNQYRDGSLTGCAVLGDLLQTGTLNQRRLLAAVNIDRRLRIYEEPARPTSPNYYVNKAGKILSAAGVPIEDHLVGSLLVGDWVMLKDIIPATVDVSRLSDPSMLLIEEIVWSPDGMQIVPRDNPGYLDLGGIS